MPSTPGELVITVNGDATYDARTTRRAVGLLLGARQSHSRVALKQRVDTPIGSGFGASGASATSAVYAVAAALGISQPKEKLALYAHRAELIEQTGLGTVSVVFDGIGAGAIIVPGEPGRARFVNVEVPKDIRLVTAYIAPYEKKDALTSRTISERISKLGGEALNAFLSDPTLDTLVGEGERFSARLGLESPEVRKLIKAAKSAGAMSASQNMIGYSVHSLTDADSSAKVARKLGSLSRGIRVDTFEVGTQRAGVTAIGRRSPGPG